MLQPRDIKIRIASAKLAEVDDRGINAQEFLRFVTYQVPDNCNALLSFDSVVTNEDDMVSNDSREASPVPLPVPLPEEQPAPQPQAIVAAQPNRPASPLLCIVCTEREKQVLLLPCKHYILCAQCFKAFVKTAKQKPGPKSKKTKKTLQFDCPFCRGPVLVHMCIENVFNG